MPANETTWRNQRLLHVVFAVSSLIMAIATVWLLARDHMREWKHFQLADRKKDAWMLQSRHDLLAEQYSSKFESFAEVIRRLDSQEFPKKILSDFRGTVIAEDERRAAARATTGDADDVKDDGEELPASAPLKATTTALVDAPTEEAQFAKVDSLRSQLAEAAARVKEAEAKLKEAAAKLDAERKAAKPAEGDAAAEPPTAAEVDAALANEKETLRDAQDDAIALRTKLLAELDTFIREAKRRELRLVGEKKTVNGMRTAVVSELGIKVGEGAPKNETDAIEARIRKFDAQLAKLTEEIASAKDYRMGLEGYVAKAGAEKAALVKERDSMQTELSRLDDQIYKNTSHIGEWITRWPVLNALYNGNVRVEQNWLPDLTINYNFSQAARFDRCTTCHRAISKTTAGSPTDPEYPTIPDEQREFDVELATPAEAPAASATLRDVYGLELSDRGIITDSDVTVHYALPATAASRAGIEAGDVILSAGGSNARSPSGVSDWLLHYVTWGKPVKLHIRRGLDHPYTAHPRLDLFLTDGSPHPQKDIGCTICHDGQGSGTDFLWTSHTPNDAKQHDEWLDKYGWFDNHHWIFPMKPARFVESNCLKCHHEKGGLEPSERFPDPPAPKLVAGWTTIEKYGCFGCHEINGYNGPDQTVGPDLRLEPNYGEVAAAILRDDKLSDDERSWAKTLVTDPTDSEVRNQLFASIKHDAARATAVDAEDEPRLAATTRKLADALKDVEIPGKYRKVGPSLRYVKSKVDFDWLYSWIRKPSDFRPSTRMPQFFGQYEHLTEKEDAAGLHQSMKFEPIEIRVLADYLLKSSGDFEYLTPENGVTEQASAERGKQLFQTRGCLACHTHADFDGIAENQGPNLTGLAGKLDTEKGRKWLYSWIRQPQRYHPRTKMPILFLDPIAEKDAQGKPTGKVTDPAADIAEYLLSEKSDWKPSDVPNRDEWTDAQATALFDLAVEWLRSDTIPESRARMYLQDGVPAAQQAKLKADEQMLVGITDENRNARLSEYVARRTIGKYGCYGCHDVPGFEDAKPIGTGLVDWGRKESSKLAFENIHRFLEMHGIDPANAPIPDGLGLTPTRKSGPTFDDDDAAEESQEAREDADEEYSAEAEERTEAKEPSEEKELIPAAFGDFASYFVQSLNSHMRDGFLWQKLRYPRSYDYKTTDNKRWNERTRMPRFAFAHEPKELEDVMTFVLGLVKEPPPAKYLFKPEGRELAIVEGRQVLDRFNCAGCHTLRMEQWRFGYDDATFEPPSEIVDYPFLAPEFTDKEIAASKAKDFGGFMHAAITGMPVVDEETGKPTWVDVDRAPITKEDLKEAEAEEGAPIDVFYRFTLYANALIAGEPRLMGLEELLIPADRDKYGPAHGAAYSAWGGDLARYLYPHVVATAREKNPQVNAKEAWGWLPPPLMVEGRKVQPDWLHGFLMDPFAIRPAVVMRMPNFHMSSGEAATLVNYFAAKSDAAFPYEYKPQQRESYLTHLQQERENPLGEAMKIVTNGNYCVKCHGIADFQPQGDPLTFGPNLANVYRRLRPNYLRDWVANPVRILPYTGMPVNIPYRADDPNLGGVSQDLYHGTSIQQITGVVDLLMNFDSYMRGETSVTPLVQQAAAAGAAGGAAAEGAAASGPAQSGATEDNEGSN